MNPKFSNWNILIPNKKELWQIINSNIWETSYREDKNRWTNCSWTFFNYYNKKWEHIKLYIKKSFFRWNITESTNDYLQIKDRFKNLIPNQTFVQWDDNIIFAFCAPISIKIDILNEENISYITKTISENPKLLKQINFFIREFEKLKNEWKILDLYWTENLIIDEKNKLYYTDSFKVFYEWDKIQSESLKKLEILKDIIEYAILQENINEEKK